MNITSVSPAVVDFFLLPHAFLITSIKLQAIYVLVVLFLITTYTEAVRLENPGTPCIVHWRRQYGGLRK